MKIPESLMDVIEEYKKANASAGPRIGRSDPLSVDIAKRQEDDEVQYLPLSNKAISTRAVARIVNRYAKQAHLGPEEIHPNVLPHTFVTPAIDGGTNVFRVQRADGMLASPPLKGTTLPKRIWMTTTSSRPYFRSSSRSKSAMPLAGERG